jgi:hypothetical protein
MKKINHSLLFTLLAGAPLLVGCVKTARLPGSASFTIINAINGSNPLIPNSTPLDPKGSPTSPLQYYASAAEIPYGTYWEGSYIGKTTISLSQLSDTLLPLYTGNFNFFSGQVYSLFLSGDTTRIDTLFSVDQIPSYAPTDSVAGIRFTNLISQGLPITINLQGNLPSQTEFNPLPYESLSNFKQFPATETTPSAYTFEIRDQVSDSLLLTFTWNFAVFKNNTIVISGSETAASQYPISAFLVNNY